MARGNKFILSDEQYPGRLIMLCDSARVLARSDRPETTPR
jgi:hypothetical protein